MKKFFMSLAVCGTLFVMASCSSSPADKAVSTLEKATKEIQKAKSEEEAMKIYEATMEKIGEIQKKAGEDYEPSEAELAKIEKAFEAFQEACDKF